MPENNRKLKTTIILDDKDEIELYNPFREDDGFMSIEATKQDIAKRLPQALIPPAPVRQNAFDDVIEERARQIKLGYTPESDQTMPTEALASAGAVYAALPVISLIFSPRDAAIIFASIWPWARSSLKPTNRRRDLVKAAALIIAEIERMDAADFNYDTAFIERTVKNGKRSATENNS